MTALIIAPLPFTETNGEVADATEVMANFNRIRDDVNNNVPLSNAIVLPDDPALFYNGEGEFTTPSGGGSAGNFTFPLVQGSGDPLGTGDICYCVSPSAGEIARIYFAAGPGGTASVIPTALNTLAVGDVIRVDVSIDGFSGNLAFTPMINDVPITDGYFDTSSFSLGSTASGIFTFIIS